MAVSATTSAPGDPLGIALLVAGVAIILVCSAIRVQTTRRDITHAYKGAVFLVAIGVGIVAAPFLAASPTTMGPSLTLILLVGIAIALLGSYAAWLSGPARFAPVRRRRPA